MGRRGTAREVSLGAMDAFLLRNRIGVPLVVGGVLKTGLPGPVRALRTHNAMRGVILGPMERLIVNLF